MKDDTAGEELPTDSFYRSLPAILLLVLVFLLNFISRVIFSPLLPEIEKDMNLAHATAGSFFLFISIGYFISMLFSGTVSSRLGHKKTIVLSSLGSGLILLLIGFCTTLVTIRIGLFCLGYAAGLYLQSGLATIFGLVSPSHLARGMGVHELAPNVGFVLAPLLCGLMLDYFSWREGLQMLGVVIVFMGLLYGGIGRGAAIKGRKIDVSQVQQIFVIPQFWLMVLLFSFAICATLGIYAMLPLYLVVEHGMDQDAANRLVAISRVSSIFMPLVAGWFGDRFGNGLVMISVLLAVGLTTVPLGIFTGSFLLFFVVLQPMVAGCFFPSGFAVLSQVGGREARGVAVSLCIPFAFLIGGGAIPVTIGAVGDHYSLATAFIGIGCIMTLAGMVVFLVNRKRNIFLNFGT